MFQHQIRRSEIKISIFSKSSNLNSISAVLKKKHSLELFPGLSPVFVRSRGAVEVGKSVHLHCDYTLSEDGEEEPYSVLWYWQPDPSVVNLDLRLWPNHGLKSRPPELPKEPVQFFRFMSIDPPGSRKKAFDNVLRGIFDVNVSPILILFSLE